MSLTISLPPEIERQLTEEAARAGVSIGDLVGRRLQEEALVRQILALGLAPLSSRHDRHRSLVRASRRRSLAAAEQSELRAVTDEAERRWAERLERLIELARLRGQALEQVSADLGIRAPEPV